MIPPHRHYVRPREHTNDPRPHRCGPRSEHTLSPQPEPCRCLQELLGCTQSAPQVPAGRARMGGPRPGGWLVPNQSAVFLRLASRFPDAEHEPFLLTMEQHHFPIPSLCLASPTTSELPKSSHFLSHAAHDGSSECPSPAQLDRSGHHGEWSDVTGLLQTYRLRSLKCPVSNQ